MYVDPTVQYMQYGVPTLGTQNVSFSSGAAPGEPQSRRKRAQDFLEEQLSRAQAGLGSAAETIQEKTKGAGEYIRTKPMRAGLRGGLAGGALMAVPSLLEGRPAEAVGGLAGSVAGGAAGALLGSAILPGVGTAIGGLAGSALGGMLGGGAAEAAVSAYTGKPPTGKAGPEVAQPPRYVDTPLGRINLNDAASMEDAMNRADNRQLNYFRTMTNMVNSNLKDLTQFQNNEEINMQKAMLPITTKLANDQLTRAQALINTQNNAYLQQMTVGGGVNLALGAQRERGATMRQALATNPYVVALNSPSIQIS